MDSQISLGHYLQLIRHRKWLVVTVFLLISLATIGLSYTLPDVYTSETVILVDPQKVPETYVKATVTGGVRDRLSTLSQQILSATRLQMIINTLNLYPQERKTLPREDVILKMRSDISVHVLSDFGGGQDLQAFQIAYSGSEPRLVAQVTNELASLFIEENLKAREQQATGTAEFLENQLDESRKALEIQEAKLRDFKLKHVGEMPEQQTADLQIFGQLQSQLQLEDEALARAEQQKSYLQSMMASQSAPVADLDSGEEQAPGAIQGQKGPSTLSVLKTQLATLLTHYSEQHPDVKKLRRQIAEEEAKQAEPTQEAQGKNQTANGGSDPNTAPAPAVKKIVPRPVTYSNPVLKSQLTTIDSEIAKHKAEQQRLSKLVGAYQAKLEVIPVREQQIADLARDHDISKAHYSQLLDEQLSAETATQLEIRQKGERFSVLDPAQPAERPSQPHRLIINAAGAAGGLMIGLLAALMTELVGMSIIAPEQITTAVGLPVLEVIPIIQTQGDRRFRRFCALFGAVSGTGSGGGMLCGCDAPLPQAFLGSELYKAFYKLKDNPFRLTPDPEFIYLSEQHREALSGLVHSVCTRAGLTVLVGEAGTGKTTLLCTLVRFLAKRSFVTAVFTNSTLTREEFYDALLLKLQIECSSTLKSRQLMALERTLLQRQAEGRRTVLIVDEAQRLSPEILEEIRLLLNIETPHQKLLNIIVTGQPELAETLARPEMRQLKQRISCICRLQPLSLEELREYLDHRLTHAGLTQPGLFTDHTIPLIYECTQGIPRLVNSVCEAALQTGFALVSPRITPPIIEEAASDLDLIPRHRMNGIASPAENPAFAAMIMDPASVQTSISGRNANGHADIQVPLEAYAARQKSLGLFASLIDRWR